MRSKYLKYIFFALVAVVIFRWFYYIDKYAVNILFWDEWDFYNPLFYDFSFIKTFTYQHGPHRQGIGFILTGIIDNLSSWNSRYIAFTNGTLILFSSFIYLLVKKKLFRNLSSVDSLIFLIVLVPAQFSVFSICPNISHGPMPAFFISLYCLSLFVKNLYLRNFFIILINFNMAYIGFGYFICIITPLIFLGETFWFTRKKENGKIIFSILSILLAIFTIYFFLIDFHYNAIAAPFEFPYSKPWEYIIFVALSYSNFFGAQGYAIPTMIIGPVILIIVFFVLMRHVIFLIKHSFNTNSSDVLLSKTIVVLIGFSLLFSFGTAVGRISLGLGAAQSSRYIPYLVPSIIGVYLHVASLNIKFKPLLILGMFLLLISASFITNRNFNLICRVSEGKIAWKNAYFEFENISKADEIAKFKIYPYPDRTKLKEKLNYLKKNKLNLYLDVHNED